MGEQQENLSEAAPCFNFHVIGTAIGGRITAISLEEAKKVLSCISIGGLFPSEFDGVMKPNAIQIYLTPTGQVIQITSVEEGNNGRSRC